MKLEILMTLVIVLLIGVSLVVRIVSPGGHLGQTLPSVALGLLIVWQASHWLWERRQAPRSQTRSVKQEK
ncbi:hypothetical protein [Paraburkholderia domus]|uniref:hypothetical protein n=1 Tax=Paraburkholderia domus TaxID=2793075 RepID=UPI0019114E0B|nr:hypothetical protein [Paraburkholderia domus]MBK5066354.1 hypothetical protein [Burkholderia sp. R-70199]CAE6969589.1 hypothetical protein R70199_08088 [Paraburkholderia domus]